MHLPNATQHPTESIGNTERPCKIAVMGVPAFQKGEGNLGVAALATASLELLTQALHRPTSFVLFGSHQIGLRETSIRIGGRSTKVPLVSYTFSPKRGLSHNLIATLLGAFLYRAAPIKPLRSWLARSLPWLGEASSVDFAVNIHGGDSFSDIYGHKRFAFQFLTNSIFLILGKPLVLLPQTMGPFKSRRARLLATIILKKARVIMVRDQQGTDVIRTLLRGDPVRPIIQTPDVAFSLTPITYSHPFNTESAPLIGLNISGLLYFGGYTKQNEFGLKDDYADFSRRLVEDLLDNSDANILLIPHTIQFHGEGDNLANERLLSALSSHHAKRVRILQPGADCQEVKHVIGRCGFFVGARMHACIAALSQGVPCIGLAYSLKFRGVFAAVNKQSSVIDLREMDANSAVLEIRREVQARIGGKELDQQVHADLVEVLRRSFRQAASTLD